MEYIIYIISYLILGIFISHLANGISHPKLDDLKRFFYVLFWPIYIFYGIIMIILCACEGSRD